jgi:hypothetical protein
MCRRVGTTGRGSRGAPAREARILSSCGCEFAVGVVRPMQGLVVAGHVGNKLRLSYSTRSVWRRTGRPFGLALYLFPSGRECLQVPLFRMSNSLWAMRSMPPPDDREVDVAMSSNRLGNLVCSFVALAFPFAVLFWEASGRRQFLASQQSSRIARTFRYIDASDPPQGCNCAGAAPPLLAAPSLSTEPSRNCLSALP